MKRIVIVMLILTLACAAWAGGIRPGLGEPTGLSAKL
jgi:hypothetical protein